MRRPRFAADDTRPLPEEQEANKRLRAENDELDAKLAKQEVELRHVREECDRLAKILKRSSVDADALGLYQAWGKRTG